MVAFEAILLALRGIWVAIPRWLKIGAVATVAALLALWSAYHLGARDGRREGREAALAQSVTILKQKAKTDAEIRDMSDADLCRALGGRLSDDGTCQ